MKNRQILFEHKDYGDSNHSIFRIIRTMVFVYSGHKFRYTYDGIHYGEFTIEMLNLDSGGWNDFANPVHVGYKLIKMGKSHKDYINECETLFELSDKYITSIFG